MYRPGRRLRTGSENEKENRFLGFLRHLAVDSVLSIDATSYLKGQVFCYPSGTDNFIKFAYQNTGWCRNPLTLDSAVEH
jgi:hypothetical protein